MLHYIRRDRAAERRYYIADSRIKKDGRSTRTVRKDERETLSGAAGGGR